MYLKKEYENSQGIIANCWVAKSTNITIQVPSLEYVVSGNICLYRDYDALIGGKEPLEECNFSFTVPSDGVDSMSRKALYTSIIGLGYLNTMYTEEVSFSDAVITDF